MSFINSQYGRTLISRIRQKKNVQLNYDKLLEIFLCKCYEQQYKQVKTAENDPNYQSNTLRVSNLLLNASFTGGSKLKFGNTYLNPDLQPIMDSLGSMEGQSGGSYKPLRNKF